MSKTEREKLRELAEKSYHSHDDVVVVLAALPALLTMLEEREKRFAELDAAGWSMSAEIEQLRIRAESAEARASRAEQATEEAEAFLGRLATEGGAIISSGKLTTDEIAFYRKCNRFFVDSNSLGYALFNEYWRKIGDEANRGRTVHATKEGK